MIIYTVLLGIAGCGLLVGYNQWVSFETINRRRFLIILTFIVSVIFISGVLQYARVISLETAEFITGGLYEFFAGLFLGIAVKLAVVSQKAGTLEYTPSEFLPRYLPRIVASIIILYGIYRTNFLSDIPYSLLSISSGTSLICFGLFGWQLRLIPEFRRSGLLILDMCIPWERLISYNWHTEDALQIDYRKSAEHISEIKFNIPAKDQLLVERIMRRKTEHLEHHEKEVENKE